MSEYVAPTVVDNNPNDGNPNDFYRPNSKGPVIYVDFDFNLATHPMTGDVILRTNEKAIKQSLVNLVMTTAGEIPMAPEIGGGINSSLFETADSLASLNIRNKIVEAVKNHERRIELEDVTVFRSQGFNGFVVQLKYRIANLRGLITETINLERFR